MEQPPDDVVRIYGDVEVRLSVTPLFEDKDVVLAALKSQLAAKVIDLPTYSQRRQAYLGGLLPPLPTDAA